MKKAVVILLLLSTLLVGCVHQNQGVTNPASCGEEPDGSTVAGSTSPENETVDSYQDVVCYPAQSYGTYLIGYKADVDVLSLQLPKSWVLTKKRSTYLISNERGEIGKISLGAAQDAEFWEPACEEERHQATETVFVSKIIEKRIDGSGFRHRYTFIYQSNNGGRTLTLTVNYAEADSDAQNLIYSAATTKTMQTDPKIGIITAPSAKNSVLILGNSFVRTSDVGDILQEMCLKTGKTCFVTAVSRGYATISTYASDTSMLDSIKAKDYGAVFICGCYSNAAEQLSSYETLRTACNTAGIPLILFPAHNESLDTINRIRNKYPDDLFLNWREEINNLINKKRISTWDFCINDEHKHSTPLAGYVGAHMIYRAIFGELPPKYQSTVFNSTSYYATLGDYVTDPVFRLDNLSTVYYYFD